MVTFNDMREFSEDEIRFIEKSSPILHQQSIIPKLELERLKKEFKNFDNSILKPDFLILNTNNNFYNVNKLKLYDYCLEYKERITYYLSKETNIDVIKLINEKKSNFFLARFGKGGAGNSVFKLCKSLNKKKYNIFAVCINNCAYKKELIKAGVKVKEINVSRALFAVFFLKKIISKIIQNSDQNYLISNINYTNLLCSIFIKKKRTLKLIAIERTPFKELEIYFLV